MGLADYKDVIATAASISSFSLLLSPVFLCLAIWKKGSSQDIPFFPLMEGFSRSVLILQQGIVLGIKPLIITHSVGLLLNLSYISVYIAFTQDKGQVKKIVLQWLTMLAPMIAYANYEDKTLVVTRYPTLVTVFTMGLMFYHLIGVKYVIAMKCTKDLPFPILLAAWFVTGFWTLYGYAIDNVALQIQTGIAFVIVSFELSLFAIYPNTLPATEKKKVN